MKTIWTSDIKDLEEKTRLEQNLVRSKWLFDRQKAVLDKIEQDLDRGEMSPMRYDTPNWDYRQADINGYRRCLRDIKDLITLDQKDTNGQSITT